jgi:hypothetical protein
LPSSLLSRSTAGGREAVELGAGSLPAVAAQTSTEARKKKRESLESVDSLPTALRFTAVLGAIEKLTP